MSQGGKKREPNQLILGGCLEFGSEATGEKKVILGEVSFIKTACLLPALKQITNATISDFGRVNNILSFTCKCTRHL